MSAPAVVIVPTGTANLASVIAALKRAGAAEIRPAESAEDVLHAERLVLPGVGAFGAAMQALSAAGLVESLRRRIAEGRATLAICLGLQLLFEESEESPAVDGLGVAVGRVRRFSAGLQDAGGRPEVCPTGSGRAGNDAGSVAHLVKGSPAENPAEKSTTVIDSTVIDPAEIGSTEFRRVRRSTDGVRVPQLGWNPVRADHGFPYPPGVAYFANSFRLDTAPPGWTAAWADYGGPFVAALARGRVLACQFHPELSGAWGREWLEAWLMGCSAPADGSAVVKPARPHPAKDQAGDNGGAGRVGSSVAGALLPRIIPCLDVRAGRIVKGVRFADLRDAGDPVARAALYEAQGADELVMLDVSATLDDRRAAIETVRAIRAVLGIPLTVGGGVRTVADAHALLEAGADRVAVNTAAVARPELLNQLAERFGRQCVVVAIDAAARVTAAIPNPPGCAGCPAAGWEVVTHSGRQRTGIDAVAWAAEATWRGAGEVLLTSFDRDGTRSGYDTGLLRAVADAVRTPVIASGGAAAPRDLLAALESGADAVLAASIFHDSQWTVGQVKAELAAAGRAVRTAD